MRSPGYRSLLASLILLTTISVQPAAAQGTILGWGKVVVVGHDDLQDLVAVAGGYRHSLGLKDDGSIVAWGENSFGQCNVPTPNTGFIAVAGGYMHSLGLKDDGSIVAWGWNHYDQCNVPAPNTGFIAVAGGESHSLGLKDDGSIVAWGYNDYGQCNVPTPNTGFVAVAGGDAHSLGLKDDGSIVAWGWDLSGQCNVPEPNTDFVAVTAGSWYSLGLKDDGSIVAWGQNNYGQCNVPAPNTGFVAVAGGYEHSLGLKGVPVAAVGGAVARPVRLTLTATPNPFRSSMTIRYALPEYASTRLAIYDTTGRSVRVLVDHRLDRGSHRAEWDGRDGRGVRLSSGMYFYELRLDGEVVGVRKTLMLK